MPVRGGVTIGEPANEVGESIFEHEDVVFRFGQSRS
jgi:hypothetical protein